MTRLGNDAVNASGEPFTTGIPLPRGAVHNCDAWSLHAGDDRALPLQARVLDRWSDGSLRWVLLDAQAPGGTGNVLRLQLRGRRQAVHDAAIRVERASEGVRLTTGRTVFTLSPASPALFQAIDVEGRQAITGSESLLLLSGVDGNWPVQWKTMNVEEAGPLRTVVRADGTADADGRALNLRA
ncbi:MAG TPA: hypothetical protein VHZ73_01505, partial [Vicinamibacterales bacterium]|nr:hypothetical protein [Vicinamibacterales bacterium]